MGYVTYTFWFDVLGASSHRRLLVSHSHALFFSSFYISIFIRSYFDGACFQMFLSSPPSANLSVTRFFFLMSYYRSDCCLENSSRCWSSYAQWLICSIYQWCWVLHANVAKKKGHRQAYSREKKEEKTETNPDRSYEVCLQKGANWLECMHAPFHACSPYTDHGGYVGMELSGWKCVSVAERERGRGGEWCEYNVHLFVCFTRNVCNVHAFVCSTLAIILYPIWVLPCWHYFNFWPICVHICLCSVISTRCLFNHIFLVRKMVKLDIAPHIHTTNYLPLSLSSKAAADNSSNNTKWQFGCILRIPFHECFAVCV